ncbi:unnamed protein product, partial [Rotaria sp. Silwood1]
MIGFGVG